MLCPKLNPFNFNDFFLEQMQCCNAIKDVTITNNPNPIPIYYKTIFFIKDRDSAIYLTFR